MKKVVRFSILALILGMSIPAFIGTFAAHEAQGYSTSSLPTTIDLNAVDPNDIKEYYSSLNNLSQSERQGTNLLKNLKTILKNGQKYYSYDSGSTIWQIYEITDRDWVKSPASSTTYGTYNSTTNKITNYQYGTSKSSSKNNPYIHALYINRSVNNQTTAWDDHDQDEWGINREHVWPKAEGFETSGAGGARGDPMHLMAGNGYSNNIHSNYYYGYVNTSKTYTNCGTKYSNQDGNLRGVSKTVGGTTNVFEPQDSDKGDIARAIFYMVARYNYLSGNDSDGIDSNNPNLELTQSLSDWASSGYSSTTSKTGKMGLLTDLLNWHKIDPVDSYEINRNNLLYTNYTNNRNPFIDHPEWVDFIWGTATYNGKTYQSYTSTPTGYAQPDTDTLYGYNSSETVAVTGVSLDKDALSIEKGSSDVLTATIAPNNATNQSVTWSSSDTTVATVSSSGTVTGVAEGTATITVTTSDGGFTDTCTVTVTASSAPVTGDTISIITNSSTLDTTGGSVITHSASQVSLTFSNLSAREAGYLQNAKNGTITSSAIPGRIVSVKVYDCATTSDKTDGGFTVYGGTSSSSINTEIGVITGLSSTASDQEISFEGQNASYFKIVNGSARVLKHSKIEIVYEIPTTLESIDLNIVDVKTEFKVNEEFNYDGLSVTANYSDGSSDIVTPTSVSSPDMSTIGTKTITVSYTEGDVTETATYDITVTEDEDAGKTTSTIIIADYADDHSWSGNTKYTSVAIDANVTAAVTTGGTNTGKYVVNGETWRFYETENGTLTISTSDQYLIDKITIFYSSYNEGVFYDENNDIVTSGNEIAVNSTSTSFTVDNSGSTYTNGQARVTSIVVIYHEVQTQPITSITATVSKTYHPGETISASDVTVKDNNNHDVNTFTLVNDGYQFKYSDAPSGGTTGTKQFTVTATPESEELSCTLTVNVSRNHYVAPADVDYSLSTTKGSFSSLNGSSSNPATNSWVEEGITFKATKSYSYSNTLAIKSSYSKDESGYVGQGTVYNETEFSTPIKSVSIELLDDAVPYSIEFSKNSSSGWTNENDGKMTFFRVTFNEAWTSGYINITSLEVTIYGSETALNVANYIMYEDTNGQCETKFDIAETYFGNMSTAERTTFMNSNDYVIKEARTRLQDWAKHLGKQIINENNDYFIRAVRPVSNIIGNIDSNDTAIIVVISILSIGTIGGYLYLRKKRHE